MQYILSQEEYNNLQFTIADLTKKYHEVQVRLDASRTHCANLQAEIAEQAHELLVKESELAVQSTAIRSLKSAIKDIVGTVHSMSDKVLEPAKPAGSDFDIDHIRYNEKTGEFENIDEFDQTHR